MYSISLNYHESITKVVLAGDITLEDIEQLSVKLSKSITKTNNLLLTDAREAKFNFGIDNLNILTGFIDKLNKNIDPDNLVFEAILTDTPKESAITILFNLEKKSYNHVYNIFSTEIAAINWLLSNNK
jgi:hypothetical protein